MWQLDALILSNVSVNDFACKIVAEALGGSWNLLLVCPDMCSWYGKEIPCDEQVTVNYSMGTERMISFF